MSAWIVVIADDLNDYLVAAQMSALRTAALGSSQNDPFANVMHDRCNYIRNRISKRIQISSTAYAVPPELKTCACLLVIEAMQARIPSLKLTEDQKTLIKRAYADLDIAVKDELPISTPDDPMEPTVQSGTSVTLVQSRTRKSTRDKMEGL